jgi:hypothetical protein
MAADLAGEKNWSLNLAGKRATKFGGQMVIKFAGKKL